jgi:predicted ATPase
MLERMAADDLSYRTYGDPSELERLVEDDLAVLLSERFLTRSEPTHELPEREIDRELPAATTRFVGRHRELRELVSLIRDPNVRLLTLSGPGGIGKTRLALAVAEAVRDEFEDGPAAVLLAPIRSSDLVATTIATALGIPVTATRSALDAVKDFLRDRELLLVIDNFEHVIAAAPSVTELLQEAHRLKVVVTSREMLRVSGEHVFPVPPLEISPDEKGDVEAVELFLDRAKAVRHDLIVTDEVFETAIEICRRLDGLPLAIELAAARVRVLTPQDILARLDSRLKLLTRGPSDLPERQRTLRDTIQWSYELLSDNEQRLFECLGVFRGGFTLEAAEGVVKTELDVLEELASLMDKSLIRSVASASEPRFLMLETLREFAIERLAERGTLEDTRQGHADYFIEWVSGIDTDGQETKAVAMMEADNDNIRAALGWSLEHDDPASVARAGAVIWKFWWVRSLFVEGIEWMQRVKACPKPLTAREAADVDFVIGILAFGHGNYQLAGEALAEARVGYEELGYIRGAALTWISLGVVDGVAGKQQGEDLLWRAVHLLREMSDDWAAAFALFGLGRVLLMRGRGNEAVPLLQESAERAERAGSRTLLSFALVNLGWARLAIEDTAGAKRAILRSLQEASSIDARESIARAVEAMAAVALNESESDMSAILFGAAEAVRRSIGAVVWVPDRPTHAIVETSLMARMGEEGYQASFDKGTALTVSDAIELAFSYDASAIPEGEEANSAAAPTGA